jgi:diguanylate cyclase (GGDEF)-like protein/putative nucleotidyltransferase with HDIG domain
MNDLSLKAKIFILTTILIGAILSIYSLANLELHGYGLLILAGLAAVAQVFKVEGSTHKSSYNISWLVYGVTFVMMGAPSTLFVILVSHLVEWVWFKYPWYIQLFNMANYAIAVTAAGLVYTLTNPEGYSTGLYGAVVTLAALAVFTLINHTYIGLVIWFARGQTISQSGVFKILTLMIDFTLISLGVATALIWEINPFMSFFVLVTIYLVYSTLQVPALQRQTEIDPKTKLYNARHFAKVLDKELDRAKSFNRPLTVVLGDLDLLRNINNTYGHLAGDVVLIRVAEILQEEFSDFDLVARFGGEEFAILMPEVRPEEAFTRVEAVRKAIDEAEFEVSTSVLPIKATISFGVAGCNSNVKSADEIIHDADVTLYRAKLMGRNVTCIHSSDGIDELFGTNLQDEPLHESKHLEARTKFISNLQPNPIRERMVEKSKPPVEESTDNKRNPQWGVNLYVGIVALTAVVLATLSFNLHSAMDWVGLLIFSLLVMLTEGLSIDIYVRETSISVSSVLLIAGVFLFGPLGALVLSVVLAATSMIKYRSKISRFIFNTSNHFISCSLCVLPVMLTNGVFTEYPVYLQVILALFSGSIIFFSSTFLLTGVMSLSMDQPFFKLWRERFRWLLGYYMAFGVSGYALILGYNTAGVIGLVVLMVPLMILRFSQVQYIEKTKFNVNQLSTKNVELENQSNLIENLNEELLLSLANVIDLRDSFTMGHSIGVADYASMIAERLGLPPERIEIVRKSGLLHDIGKIGIPDSILYKPGPLTYKEFEIIKHHPVRGAEIVDSNRTLCNLSPIIRHHHERYDGSGYPDGIRGQEIPLEARILSVSDAIQSMASTRPYRKAMSLPEIMDEIEKHSGTQFDPEVVKATLDIMRKEETPFITLSPKTQPVKVPEPVELVPFSERLKNPNGKGKKTVLSSL